MPILTLPFTSLSKKWGYSGDQKMLTGKTEYKHNTSTLFVYYNMLKNGRRSKIEKIITNIHKREKERSRSYFGMTSMIFKSKKGMLILKRTEI